MTVSSSTDRATFLGNNATTVFALPFRFFANGEINAWLITNATGALTALTLGTHYTLTGASDPEVDGSATGQLTMITPPTSAQSLFVQRIIPVTQPTDIVNQGQFFPEIHENVFDRLTMLNQQNAGALNRAIRVQDFDPEPAKLPSAAQRALKIMSFDADGNPVAIDAARDSSLVLRQDLANATDQAKGARLVGYKNTKANSVARTVAAKLNDIYTMEDAGVVGDNVTDDTAAIQRWVYNIGQAGGGTARMTEGKTYYVPGTIVIPKFVSIDLNGCTFRGNRPGGGTASMFMSGYFNAGVLVTNVGGPEDAMMLDGIRVFNGRILEAYRGMEWTNANRTCAIRDITFTGCLQAWLLTRCWSIQLSNCFADTASDFNVPTYKFVEAINTMVLDQVRAVTDFAFEFSSKATGSASIVFLNCDVEGSQNRAFYFQGQFNGITWIGGYFEAIPGVLYDFADVTSATVNWRGTFNYLSGTLLREPTGAQSNLEGEWDTSNAIEGAGTVIGPTTYSSTLNIQHPRNSIKFRLRTDYETKTTLPAFVNVGANLTADIQQISSRIGSGTSDILSRGISSKGVLPLHYSGDTGRTFPDQVAFSTHTAFTPGASSITILVTTQIVFRPETTFAKYRFTVTDNVGTYVLFGDIYGGSIKPQDSTGKTVAVVDAGGFLRVELYGFTHPTGVYTCTGTVQLCT